MTILDVHILIEQMLQQMGNFAYGEVLPEEIDVALNFVTNKSVRTVLTPNDKRQPASISKDGFEEVQLSLDDLRVIKVEDYELTGLTVVGNKVKGILPNDYFSLINDRSVLNKPNCSSIEKPNRLTDSEVIKDLMESELAKTKPESPLSTISGNQLSVYTDNFSVTKIIIDYYRKPVKIDFNNPANGAGIIEFPDSTFERITERTAMIIASWIEQPQNKVQQLRQMLNDNS